MAPPRSPSSHKARKSNQSKPAEVLHRPTLQPEAEPLSQAQQPTFPLAAFLWPARSGTSQWVILPLVLMVVGLYRWTAGLWNYSGFQSPPMHGDFEAQRHWMEITIHLPITQWYFHDLDWWGLDYPPLTAYHSWFLGKLGSFINPSWFAMHISRGLDDPSLKIFMRATVLISEYLTYIPAIVIVIRHMSRTQRVSSWETSIALVAILMQPGTILIDHAHFQYNTIMLGLVVAAIGCMISNHMFWASVFFVFALGFKQMALYYAPVVFAYMLGSCFNPRIDPIRLIGIAIVTIISFAVLFLPLLIGAISDWYYGISNSELFLEPAMFQVFGLDAESFLHAPLLQLTQCVHRMFPFARGLFEDKVANFWCALHTFYKLRSLPTGLLQQLSLSATGLAILPPFFAPFFSPRPSVLLPALAASAWGFFLFSFQVHEKSVLLPLLPMTFLLAGERGLDPSTRSWLAWANILGSWTLFPLLKRDELRVPYFVLTLLWGWLMGAHDTLIMGNSFDSPDVLVRLLHGSFYLAMIVWHVAEAFVPPPAGKPDLWVVINVLIGAAGFGICYLWCLWKVWDALPVSKVRIRGGGKVKTK